MLPVQTCNAANGVIRVNEANSAQAGAAIRVQQSTRAWQVFAGRDASPTPVQGYAAHAFISAIVPDMSYPFVCMPMNRKR
jgi:hypothetical protein